MKNNEGNINDKRAVKLANVLDEKFIPFLTGRPVRDSVITSDDILNLKIALHVSNTVEELLPRI